MKKINIIIIFVAISIFSYGQKTTPPDTIYNTEYIDVVRVKDTANQITEGNWEREIIDVVNFSNGVKIYSNNVYYPKISKNGEYVVIINYRGIPRNYDEFKEITFDVYDYEGNFIKCYQYLPKDFKSYKILNYEVFNNSNLLILTTSISGLSFELFIYQNNNLIVNLFEQRYKDNYKKISEIQTSYQIIEEEHLLFLDVHYVKQGEKEQRQFQFYDFDGNLYDSYDFTERVAPGVNLSFTKKFEKIKLSYKMFYKKNEEFLFFDIKEKKFIKNEK
jgi:hypothetical protein